MIVVVMGSRPAMSLSIVCVPRASGCNRMTQPWATDPPVLSTPVTPKMLSAGRSMLRSCVSTPLTGTGRPSTMTVGAAPASFCRAHSRNSGSVVPKSKWSPANVLHSHVLAATKILVPRLTVHVKSPPGNGVNGATVLPPRSTHAGFPVTKGFSAVGVSITNIHKSPSAAASGLVGAALADGADKPQVSVARSSIRTRRDTRPPRPFVAVTLPHRERAGHAESQIRQRSRAYGRASRSRCAGGTATREPTRARPAVAVAHAGGHAEAEQAATVPLIYLTAALDVSGAAPHVRNAAGAEVPAHARRAARASGQPPASPTWEPLSRRCVARLSEEVVTRRRQTAPGLLDERNDHPSPCHPGRRRGDRRGRGRRRRRLSGLRP